MKEEQAKKLYKKEEVEDIYLHARNTFTDEEIYEWLEDIGVNPQDRGERIVCDIPFIKGVFEYHRFQKRLAYFKETGLFTIYGGGASNQVNYKGSYWFDYIGLLAIYYGKSSFHLALLRKDDESVVDEMISESRKGYYGYGRTNEIIPIKPSQLARINHYPGTKHSDLINLMVDKGVSIETQKKFNLKFENGYYFNSVIIPYFDANGELVGYNRRKFYHVNQKENEKKYGKFKTMTDFDKKCYLYGINEYRANPKDPNTIYVFEGEKAIMLAHQYGITNCVATGGHNLTSHHLWLMLNVLNAKTIVLAYDDDVEEKLGPLIEKLRKHVNVIVPSYARIPIKSNITDVPFEDCKWSVENGILYKKMDENFNWDEFILSSNGVVGWE